MSSASASELELSRRPPTTYSDADTSIRFILDGQVEEIFDLDPTTTLLDVLRYRMRRTGTKEGCAEGDCGACTVLIGDLGADEAVQWRAVNACILFAPMIDGRALMTVESLALDGGLSESQTAMIELNGSQCGFCTPGFVMSLHGASLGALGARGTPPTELLAGNLCRCTGYGPILAAAERIRPRPRDDRLVSSALQALRRKASLALEWLDPSSDRVRRWFSPQCKDQLAELLIQHPDATLVAGATDVGLWVTKRLETLDTVIFLGECADLRGLSEDGETVRIGAGVRYSEALEALSRLHPELGALIRRIGAVQVRNAGTIGGNIANGSPIADMAPALIALGATIVLRRGCEQRVLALEDFFLAYGRQDRRPGEFLEEIRAPRLDATTLVRIVKLTKRFDSDISAVCGAFALTVDEGMVKAARIAFGGMAATPARAIACETALIGHPWSPATTDLAAEALARDFNPISDVRGSSTYRRKVAANMVRQLWREAEGLDGPPLLAVGPIDG